MKGLSINTPKSLPKEMEEYMGFTVLLMTESAKIFYFIVQYNSKAYSLIWMYFFN
ncbi:hypothetical protein ACNQGJ_08665 [Flavobacterium sp. GT2P42]|uniref:hypothetical protein n=1 Tax=Flavobacterium sp. GT2P42 TaxID=3401732 RepID=UPI003AAB4C47